MSRYFRFRTFLFFSFAGLVGISSAHAQGAGGELPNACELSKEVQLFHSEEEASSKKLAAGTTVVVLRRGEKWTVVETGRSAGLVPSADLPESCLPSMAPLGKTCADEAEPAAAEGETADGKPSALKKALRIAVYEFGGEGLEPRVAKVVTESVVAEVRKLQRVAVVSMDEVKAMLDHEAQKQMVGCDDASCLSEIAAALGVDGLVIGQVMRVNETDMFIMRRIDQRKAEVMGTVNKQFEAGESEAFLAEIGPAVEELFPEFELKEGQERGVSKEAAQMLNPPPLKPWIFWSTSAAGGAALLTGVVSGIMAKNFETAFQGLMQEAAIAEISGTQVKNLQEQAITAMNVANGFYGLAVLFGTSAGVEYLFTDWHGYGEMDLE